MSINKLINGDYGAISGPIKIGGQKGILTGNKGDMLTLARNIVNSQTLKSLADAKAKGITFGALSEGELNLVSAAADRLNSRAERNSAGQITGFSGSESAFLEDLKTLKEKLQKAISNKTGENSTLNNWGGTVLDTYTNNSNNNYGFK